MLLVFLTGGAAFLSADITPLYATPCGSMILTDATSPHSLLPSSSSHYAGVVVNAETGTAVEYPNLYLRHSRRNISSDRGGRYQFDASTSDTLRVSSLGYAPLVIPTATLSDSDTLRLAPKSHTLQEVVVERRKVRYSKKDNPAHELMTRIRAAMSKGDPYTRHRYNYDYYSNIALGLNDFDISDARRLKCEEALAPYLDTASYTGRPILLISFKERAGTRIHAAPSTSKDIITAISSHGIDHDFGVENVRRVLEDILREVDLYGNDITLMQQRFVSPLSAIAGDFYHYYITDTIATAQGREIELSFAPANPESFGFNGKMYVAFGDTTGFIHRVEMRVPRVINLNFVDNIFITQTFSQDTLGLRHKSSDEIVLEVTPVPGGQSMYARRHTLYRHHNVDTPSQYDNFLTDLRDEIFVNDPDTTSMETLAMQRLTPLSQAEAKMDGMLQNMRKFKVFYWMEKTMLLLSRDFWISSERAPWAWGPLSTLASYNDVEGLRLRLGGMTLASFSPHFFLRGYTAYGCRDHKWKYNAEMEYSFSPKKQHAKEFPVHSITVGHRYDLDMIGQHYLFGSQDNIFLSLKRGHDLLTSYLRTTHLAYNLELRNNFSISAGMRHNTQEASPWVQFRYANGTSLPSYTQANLFLKLRYAPGEKYVETNTGRYMINFDAPELHLTHEYGVKGWLGSRFGLHRTEALFKKRFWLSAFGYLNTVASAGKIWNAVPFPSLLWPNANLSYIIQPESYSMMNAMEFANDWYTALDLGYFGQGVLFNRIPVIRKAKLREVVTFKALYGGLTRKNNPRLNADLLQFPESAPARIMQHTPYMEISAGIDNIFSILRVEYIWRLSYLHYPDVPHGGIRAALHFSF